VSAFLRQAEEILDVASGGAGPGEMAIILNGAGSLRMMDPTGWTLPALSAEFGAAAVFRVERRGTTLRVEGFNGSERCLLQREARTPRAVMNFGNVFGGPRETPGIVAALTSRV